MINLDKGNLIRNGSHSTVYKLGDYAVKVAKDWGDMKVPEHFLRNEFQIATELHLRGITVPTPEGIYLFEHRGKTVPGFMMKYVPGEVIQEMSSFKIFAFRKLEGKIKKARDEGFIVPEDRGTKNGIISSRDGKIYLIDFWGWERN